MKSHVYFMIFVNFFFFPTSKFTSKVWCLQLTIEFWQRLSSFFINNLTILRSAELGSRCLRLKTNIKSRMQEASGPTCSHGQKITVLKRVTAPSGVACFNARTHRMQASAVLKPHNNFISRFRCLQFYDMLFKRVYK